MCLKAVVVNQLYRLDVEFCLASTSLNMNMHRFMITGVEHEPEVEYFEYSWHGISSSGRRSRAR